MTTNTEDPVQRAREEAAAMAADMRQESVRLSFSVLRIAMATGATRQTVYNWFSNGQVAPFYRARVAALLDILKKADTAEQAWRKACSQFNLNP